MFPEATNPELAVYEAFKEYIKELFAKEPWSKNIGQKEIKVIRQSQNEPDGVYIRLTKMGGKNPICMGDGNFTWLEYHLVFALDFRIPESDAQSPINKNQKVTVKNPKTNISVTLGDSGEIVSNVTNAVRTTMEFPKWRRRLSELGIHNVILMDEAESFMSEETEYQNPLRMELDIYVLTTELL